MTDGPITFTGLIKFLQYIKGPDHWHYVGETGEPAFENSWVNEAATNAARFMKNAAGVVHIQGVVQNGTIGQDVFTLPIGYRPDKNLWFSQVSNNAFAKMVINTDGTIEPASGNNANYSIACSFYVG